MDVHAGRFQVSDLGNFGLAGKVRKRSRQDHHGSGGCQIGLSDDNPAEYPPIIFKLLCLSGL
jgi:hypothetical protein